MKKLVTLTLLLLIAPCVADAQAPPGQLSVTISDVRVVEGGAGPRTPAVFEVTLSGAVGAAQVTVNWTTQDLTADGADYQGDSGVLVFGAAGTQTVTVNVWDDQATEATEVFHVQIAASASATVTKPLGHAAIHDDDTTPGVPNCDLDGDGHSNLMAVYTAHPDHLPHEPKHEDWEGGGTLVFPGDHTVVYVDEVDQAWQLEAMNDFDGNGTCDLFWARNEEVTLTMTPPGGAMTAPHDPDTILPSPGPDWRLVGSGHFNPDGAADLIWWRQPSRELLAWVSSGGTPWTYSEHALDVPGPGFSEPLAVADIHGDGHKGILSRRSGGQLTYWRMDGLQFVESQIIGGLSVADIVGPDWRLAAVGDFNKDDTDDLIWQEPTGKRVAVWFMSGLGRVAESLLSPERLMDDDEAGMVRGPR